MSPSTGLVRMLSRGTAVLAAAGLVVVGAVVPLPAASAATTTLSITPLGWNIVGLDSNDATGTTGPARYAVGAKVCNTGSATASAVTPTWAWTSANTYINLLGSTSKTAVDLAPSACRYWWWTVDIARNASAFLTTRGFRITAAAGNATSVQTPANREIYVEKLNSQARNKVTASSGPTSVYVGGTYTWSFTYDTGTFNQVMAGAFLDPSIFEITSVSQTYTTGGSNDQFYNDACLWKNDTTAAGYRSCTNNNKVGGTIVSTVVATVTGTGTTTIAPLVLDGSGSSYHYNTDYSTSVYAMSVTATAPPAPTANADSATTGVATQVDVDVLANDSAGAGTLSTGSLAVTVAPTHGTASIVAGKLRYTPTAGYVGTDTVTYQVCNSFSTCSTAVVTITVAGPPVASADFATAATAVATTIDVLGNDSSPGGLPLSISSVTSPAHGTATVVSGQVRYTSVSGYHGPDSFSYTVSDGNGGSSTATVSVTVVNSAPSATADSASTDASTPVTIAVLTNDSDPNGDALTVSAVTQPSNGAVSINADGTVRYVPKDGFKGADTFTYTVSDGFGGTAVALVTVSVANAAPVAAGDSTTTAGGTPATIAVLGNDTDPNSDPLTPSIVSSPAHGSAVVNPDGTVTYTPAAGFRGDDTFTYTVSDGTASSAPATVTVTVGNTAPSASTDSVTTHGPATVAVTANDSDANGDTLTITSAGPAGHGTVTVNADGTITYVPAPGFFGPDSFTYTVSDGFGGSAAATVHVTVTNVAPVATPDDVTLVHGPGASTTVDVVVNDTDADGDPLTLTAAGPAAHGTIAMVGGKLVYTPDAGYVGDDVVTYTVSDGHGGTTTGILTVHVTNTAPVAVADAATTPTSTPVTVSVLGNDSDADSDTVTVASAGPASHGTVVVDADGTITYTPNVGYRGGDSFTYTVTDGTAPSAPATVTITVLNAPPVAGDDLAGTASSTPVVVDVLGNDSDPNGDSVGVSSVGAPLHGVASLNPDGTVTYTPAAGFAGTDSFSYTVSDGVGGTASALVTVVVGGAGPVAVDDVATTLHGVTVAIDVVANDSDPNPGDVVTVQAIGAPAHGSAFVLAGLVYYTPDAGFVGDDSFTYVATDGNGGVASATVTVTVTNTAPTTTPDETSVVHGGTVDHDVVGNDTDVDADAVSLVSVIDGAHGTATVVAGKVRYVPVAGFVGDDQVTYTVSDGVGGSTTGVLTIHVTNAAPTATDDSASTASGATTTIAVLGNDSDPDGDALTISAVDVPAHGTAVVVAGGIRYTADSTFDGVETFTYTVSDGHGGTSTATVTITVLPSSTSGDTLTASVAPVCVSDVPYVDYSLTLLPGARVLGGVGAAPGTALAVWRDSTGAVVASWSGLAMDGRILWPGAAVDAGGHVTDWPGWIKTAAGWVPGSDGFENTRSGSTLEVTVNGITSTVPVSFPSATSACVPAPRLQTAEDSASTTSGTPVVVPVRGNDTGVDSGAKVVVTTPPSHGTVVVNPDGTTTYTPDPGFAGTDTYGYTVTNADGQVSSTTVTVTVTAGGSVEEVDSEHPQTGGDVGGLLGLGVLLLLGGAFLRRSARA